MIESGLNVPPRKRTKKTETTCMHVSENSPNLGSEYLTRVQQLAACDDDARVVLCMFGGLHPRANIHVLCRSHQAFRCERNTFVNLEYLFYVLGAR